MGFSSVKRSHSCGAVYSDFKAQEAIQIEGGMI
jgi:hypothetical protein